MILLKDGEQIAEVLYIDEFDELYAKWIGHKLTISEASKISGVYRSNIKYIKEFEEDLKEMLDEYKIVYLDLENLEYGFLELPRPDLTLFLYVPYKKVAELRSGRREPADQHESNPLHIRNAEHAYLELAELHDYKKINCLDKKNKLRDIEDIQEDVYNLVIKEIEK